MGPADFAGVPLENVVRALRRLAPGAALRVPRPPALRALAEALRDIPPEDIAALGDRCPGQVVTAVLTHQLAALDRAMTGFFGPQGECALRPEGARLVRAARYSGGWHAGPPATRTSALHDRLRAEPGLRAAAIGWAEVVGFRVLSRELRRPGHPTILTTEDVRLAASLAVSATLPRLNRSDPPSETPDPSRPVAGPRGARLAVRGLGIGASGFRVTVSSSTPMDLSNRGDVFTLRALHWPGLIDVRDNLGHAYLILARDTAPSGDTTHWCHPSPAPSATGLQLTSGPFIGEQLRFAPHGADRPSRTSVEIPVRLELTASLAA
jgi:hypothetical protein